MASCKTASYLKWYIQAAAHALFTRVGRGRLGSSSATASLQVTCQTSGSISAVRWEPSSTTTRTTSWDWLSTTLRVWRTGVSLLVRVALPQLVLGIVGGGIDGVMHALVASRSPLITQVVLFEALPQLMAATSAMCFRNHGGLEYANATDLRSIDWLQHSQRQQRAFFPAHVHRQLFQGSTSFQGAHTSDAERNICHHLEQSQRHISRNASFRAAWLDSNDTIRCRLANLASEPHFSRAALLRYMEDVTADVTPDHASIMIHLGTQVVRIEEGVQMIVQAESKRGAGLVRTSHHVDFLVRSIGAFSSPPPATSGATATSKLRFVRAMLQMEVSDPRGSHCEAVGSSFTLLGEYGSMLEVVPSALLSDEPGVVSRQVHACHPLCAEHISEIVPSHSRSCMIDFYDTHGAMPQPADSNKRSRLSNRSPSP
jgi:hypothetical protein